MKCVSSGCKEARVAGSHFCEACRPGEPDRPLAEVMRELAIANDRLNRRERLSDPPFVKAARLARGSR